MRDSNAGEELPLFSDQREYPTGKVDGALFEELVEFLQDEFAVYRQEAEETVEKLLDIMDLPFRRG